VLGGIFILVLAVIALFWSRTRARKMDREVEPKTIPVAAPRSRPEAMTSPNTLASAQSPPDATEIPPRELAEQVRVLQAEMQRLSARRADDRSSLASDSASVARSLSTMKSDQTRVVQSTQRGYAGGVRGAVIHTDSGMRLSAARLSSVVDEFPPRTR
jgi:hypothetical protein